MRLSAWSYLASNFRLFALSYADSREDRAVLRGDIAGSSRICDCRVWRPLPSTLPSLPPVSVPRWHLGGAHNDSSTRACSNSVSAFGPPRRAYLESFNTMVTALMAQAGCRYARVARARRVVVSRCPQQGLLADLVAGSPSALFLSTAFMQPRIPLAGGASPPPPSFSESLLIRRGWPDSVATGLPRRPKVAHSRAAPGLC